MKKYLRSSIATLIVAAIMLMMSSSTAFASSSNTVTYSFAIYKSHLAGIGILVVLCVIIILYLHHRRKATFEKLYNNRVEKLNESQQTINKLRKEKKFLHGQITELETWQHDAVKIYPDIQEQIDEMHAKAKAAAFDKNCNSAINRKASANSFHFLDSLMNAYNQMSDLEKSYVTTDISKIAEKWNKAAALYAGVEKHE